MIKKLSRQGNSLALVVDKAILELLKITPDTPLDIETDGKSLTITPVREVSRKQLSRSIKKVAKKYGRTLRHVED